MLRDKRADGLVVNKWGTLALILRVCDKQPFTLCC